MKGRAGKTLSVTVFPSFGKVVAPKVQLGTAVAQGWVVQGSSVPAQAGVAAAGHVNRLQPGGSWLNLTLAAFHGSDQGCAMTQEQSLEEERGCG